MRSAMRRCAAKPLSKRAQLGLFLSLCLVTFTAAAIPIPVALNVSTTLGSGWEQTVTSGFFPTYSLNPVGEHSVSIFFDDGSKAVFDFSIIPNSSVLIPIQYPSDGMFTPRVGTSGA